MNARSRGWLVRRALLAADVLGLSAAFVLSQVFAGAAGEVQGRHDLLIDLMIFLVALPIWVVAAKLAGLYARDEQRADHSTADDFVRVLHLLTLGTWIVYAGTSAAHLAGAQLSEFFLFWVLSVVLVTGCRALTRSICRRHPAFVQNTLIVGAGDVGQIVARKILQHPEYGIRLLGFVDSMPRERVEGLGRLPVLGQLEDLPEVIPKLKIERVIVAFSMESHTRTLKLIRALRDFDVHVDIVPRLFELVPATADIHTLEGMALIGLPSLRLSRSSLLLKRVMDLVMAIVGLLVLAPLLLAIAVLIKLDSSGPALFRQVRVGRNQEFVMLKFRTMFEDADLQKDLLASLNKHARKGGDPRMFKIPDDPRVTKLGRFLRKYSLDELPQFWNVVKGDMSLVGRRPLILEEHRHVDGWGHRRLDLKPGITGLWQISGRDAVPFGEMVRLDYFYVTTWSPWNDVRILFRTLPILGKGERPLQWA
jgi:exopolysaccharide biosynthesis polyprenyl glycosylphosphotransferase